MNDPESKLTIHIESDNFADGGLDSVACDAKVNAGVESADVWQLQLSSVMDWNWKRQVWFQCCFLSREGFEPTTFKPSNCVLADCFYLSYYWYAKEENLTQDLTFSTVSLSPVLTSISGILVAEPDVFAVLSSPRDGRGGVSLCPAGQSHAHPLRRQRVRTALLVNNVRRNWKKKQ